MQQANLTAAAAPSGHQQGAVTPTLGKRIKVGEGPYNEIQDFLIEEAFVLDEDLLADWLMLLAEDVLYTMPIRQTVQRQKGSGFQRSSHWIYEDFSSLQFKVKRLTESDSAFAEDPPSRTRRLITNLRLHETATEGEFFAQSYILLRRNRGDAHLSDAISARRDDIIRRTPKGWKLAQRTIFIDQAVLGTPNLAIFF